MRQATVTDVPELVRVINSSYRVEDFFVTGDRTSMEDVDAMMGAPASLFLVEPMGGSEELAGAVYVQLRGERGYFGPLAVDPRCQGQGLGKALVNAAEEYCRARGCRHIDIDVVNLRAELPPFYQKLGYKPSGTAPFTKTYRLRREAHLILMTKALDYEGS